jgi:septal ring-binding cell division protein DamX
MYWKLNCQYRERQQSIQDVARPRNSRGVIKRRVRRNVYETRVRNDLNQVATTLKIGEMQQQQKTNGGIWGCSMQGTRQSLRTRVIDGWTLQQRCQFNNIDDGKQPD